MVLALFRVYPALWKPNHTLSSSFVKWLKQLSFSLIRTPKQSPLWNTLVGWKQCPPQRESLLSRER